MPECPGFLSIKHSSTHPKGFLCVGTNDSIWIHCCEYIYRLCQSIVSIHIRITEKSISNFESNPIGYQTKQTVEEPKTARSLLDSRVKDSTNSSLYGKTGSDGAHQHTFLRSNIENSTFHHPPGADGPPFSPERETYGMLLFIQLLHSCLLRRGSSSTCYRYSYTPT